MGLQNSYLSQAKYGYDTVVAVSQKALNATIKNYYKNIASSKTPFTEQTCYFIALGDSAMPVERDFVLAQTGGIDPLLVTSSQTANINKIRATNFYFAFQFTPGDPTGSNNFTYLNINPGTQVIEYFLLCTDIKIALWNYSTNAWVNVSQSRVNEFNISAKIPLKQVLDNTNLPSDVQAAVNNLGSTDVNVQQLLLDLDNASANPDSASIPGIDSLYLSMNHGAFLSAFASAYLKAYEAVEVPRLNYAITQANTSSLIPSSVELYVGALVDSKGNLVAASTDNAVADLATINYLFSVNGDALPTPAQFNWNWLEDNGANNPPSVTPDTDPQADLNQHNGAVAINRNAFANYMNNQLASYVNSNCYKPSIEIGSFPVTAEFTINIDFGQSAIGGVQPLNLSKVGAGADTLLQYSYSGNATATGWYPADTMSVNTFFALTLTVDTPDNYQQLTLTQTIWVYVDSTGDKNAGYTQQGNPAYQGRPISKTFIDHFSVVVDAEGNLNLVTTNSQVIDNSDTNLPEYITLAMVMFKNYNTAANFKEVPVSLPKQFVFPGGDAFAFQDVQFSAYSDLVCHVTYKSES